MREPSPDVDMPHVYGALHLLKRKTGEVASHIALDTTRVTLGRERECDIRLYFEDVSKMHAEILFDEESGIANLIVHGNNGLIYTPAGGAGKQYFPPSVLALGDGDTLQIRKKLFRFSYGDTLASSYHSPARTPARDSRRLSHRLSIVPQGKRFAPSPAKSRFATPARKGSQVDSVEEEEDEPLVFDELVGLAEGDEGDKIYLEKRDDKPKNPFMTPQPKGRAPLRNTSAVPRTRTITFALPTQPPFERNMDEDENEYVSEDEMAVLEEDPYGGVDEGVDDDVPAPATPTPAPIPLPEVSPMGGPRRPVVTPRAAYATPRGPGSDSLRRALLIRSARKRLEAETVESEIVSGHVEMRRRRSSGRTLSPPKPDSDSSEASEDEDKENTPGLQWVYEDGQGVVDDSDSDRESLDTEYSIPGARILDFHTSPDPGSPSESEEEEVTEESGEEYEENYADERDQPNEEQFPLEEGDICHEGDNSHEGDVSHEDNEEMGDISSDIDDEVDHSLVCPPEDVERSPSPVAARFYTPQPKRTMYAGARLSLAGIGAAPVRFAEQPSSVSEHLPTGMRIPPTPNRLGKPERVYTPGRAIKAEEQPEEKEEQAPTTPPPATPPSKTPARGGLTPAQRAALATPLHLPAAPSESFRDSVPRPIETPRRSTFLEALRSAKKSTVSFDANTSTPARSSSTSKQFGSMRKRMPTPRVDRIEEVDSLPPTPTAVEDVARVLYPLSPSESPSPPLQPAPANSTPDRNNRRRSLSSMAGIRDLLSRKSPKPTTLGLDDLIEPKAPSPKTPSFAGMREMFRAPHPSPALGGMRELFAEKAVPPTPHMALGDVFPEPEEKNSHEESQGSASESGEESEPTPKPQTRSRVPTRSIPARTTRAASKPQDEPKEREVEKHAPKTRRRVKVEETAAASPEPVSAPARSTRRQAAPPKRSASPPETHSAPTRRVTRSQTAEPEEEAQSAPTRRLEPKPVTRRSRRVLGDAEPEQEPAVKAAPKAAPKKKAAAPRKAAAPKTEKTTSTTKGVADKENSATPDPEPKRKTALPVRVTRSRKA